VNIEDIVESLERHCGDTESYSVYMRREAFEKWRGNILEKLSSRREVGGIFVKGVYKGYEVSIFNNGRVVISGAKSEEDLIRLLEELLSF